MGNKSNHARKRKRNKFNGYITKQVDITPAESTQCVRKRKILDSSFATSSEDVVDSNNYNVIINFGLLKKFISKFSSCPECHSSDIKFFDDSAFRMGYSHKLKFSCHNWPYNIETFTSEQCEKQLNVRGRKKFEINVRAVAAFREIGKGHEGMVNVSSCMNMFHLGEPAYHAVNDALQDAYEFTANVSMKQAATEANTTSNDMLADIPTCRVSLDGTWQKRGFSSLNGIVTAMSNSKCLDVHVMSKYCKQCVIWEGRKGNPNYDSEQWKLIHYESGDCEINHTKSSGAMEAAGAIEIFCRSIEKNGLIYNKYLGDGDTSSFTEVVNSQPYANHGDIIPEKLECVGHVQKRLGTRLRNKIKSYKGTKTPLSGRGKLTDKVINSMQNYYGIAIRDNKNELYAMKNKSIL